jgi:excisionase family DNA binding protein
MTKSPNNKESAGIPLLLTVSEAAKRLSVSPSTLARLIRARKIRALNVSARGNRPSWRISVKDLRRFIQSESTEATAMKNAVHERARTRARLLKHKPKNYV